MDLLGLGSGAGLATRAEKASAAEKFEERVDVRWQRSSGRAIGCRIGLLLKRGKIKFGPGLFHGLGATTALPPLCVTAASRCAAQLLVEAPWELPRQAVPFAAPWDVVQCCEVDGGSLCAVAG